MPAQIEIVVRLNGVLAQRLGPRRAFALPADGATVGRLLDDVRAAAGLDTAPLAVAVGGAIVGAEHVLATGDAVAILVPAAGGSV